jgi:hypothetical protein
MFDVQMLHPTQGWRFKRSQMGSIEGIFLWLKEDSPENAYRFLGDEPET